MSVELLKDRVVLVAGVGPGLGRAVALVAAGAGADVVLAARTPATLDAVAAEVRALGRSALCVPTDLSDTAQCEALVDAALSAYGHIDVYVHNTFTRSPLGPATDRTPDEWRAALDGNVVSATSVIGALAPSMRARRSGSVVFVSSVSGRQPFRNSGLYATMKAALLTLTKVLAQDFGPDNVRVNAVVPGYIDGAGLDRFFGAVGAERGVSPSAARAELAAGTCLERFASADEVAQAVLFFASDLSSAITGQSLDVNAGQWFG